MEEQHYGVGPHTCGARLEDIPLAYVLLEREDGVRVWKVAPGWLCPQCGRPLSYFEEAATLEIPARRIAVEAA